MTHRTSELPPRWTRAPIGPDRELSLLVRGLHEHRRKILERYPLLKLPSDAPGISTPVAALVLSWERWSYMRGRCPDCGAPALGISFGGLLNVGLVGGVCTQCAAVVSRPIAGFVVAARGARASVEGTPYEFGFVNWRWGFRGIPRPLVLALKRLGVKELPTPRSGADEPGSGGGYWTDDGERIA